MTYLVLTRLLLQCFHAIYLLQGISKPWCITPNFGAVTIYTSSDSLRYFACPKTPTPSTRLSTAYSTHRAQAMTFLSTNVNTLNGEHSGWNQNLLGFLNPIKNLRCNVTEATNICLINQSHYFKKRQLHCYFINCSCTETFFLTGFYFFFLNKGILCAQLMPSQQITLQF